MTIDQASKLFLPTRDPAPADAEAISHKLLVRAGYIRQLSAGLWTFTRPRLARAPETRRREPSFRSARRSGSLPF